MSTSEKFLNIFDLQMGLDNTNEVPIQESIDYCESRFRKILTAFGRSEDAPKQLIQRGLHQELVRFLECFFFSVFNFLTVFYFIIHWHGDGNRSIY